LGFNRPLMETGRRIPIAYPLIGDEEREGVLAVLQSGQLTQGKVVPELEARFADWCGANHAVAVSSGTAALHVALLAHGIKAGDEVITSPFTFIASANAVLFVGARPVFVDVEPETFCLDPSQVEAAITPRTRAILPVHLYGHPAAMPQLAEIASRHGVLLIEDACQAHGATVNGQKVGTLGQSAAFSLYPSKNMTAGEGGFITTNDDELAHRARLLRSHGSSGDYRHHLLGYNFRLSDVHAAIGLAQLRKLDGFNASRRRNAEVLSQGLSGLASITTPTERPGYAHVYHQYTVRVHEGRNELQRTLMEAGVESRIYYPLAIHQQPLYQELGYDGMRAPVAERLTREVLSIPVHPAVTELDLERIVHAVRRHATETS
jgi:perosamine synthetase